VVEFASLTRNDILIVVVHGGTPALVLFLWLNQVVLNIRLTDTIGFRLSHLFKTSLIHLFFEAVKQFGLGLVE